MVTVQLNSVASGSIVERDGEELVVIGPVSGNANSIKLRASDGTARYMGKTSKVQVEGPPEPAPEPEVEGPPQDVVLEDSLPAQGGVNPE